MGSDCDLAAADRSRNRERQDHTANLQQGNDHSASLLSLAQGVGWAEARGSEAVEGAGEGELAAEAAGGRSIAGETAVKRCGLGKLLSPKRHRFAVERPCEAL